MESRLTATADAAASQCRRWQRASLSTTPRCRLTPVTSSRRQINPIAPATLPEGRPRPPLDPGDYGFNEEDQMANNVRVVTEGQDYGLAQRTLPELGADRRASFEGACQPGDSGDSLWRADLPSEDPLRIPVGDLAGAGVLIQD